MALKLRCRAVGWLVMCLAWCGLARPDSVYGPELLQRIAQLEHAVEAAVDRNQRSAAAQQLAYALAEASDDERALRLFPVGPASLAPPRTTGLADRMQCRDAVPVLLEQARGRRLVMINEVHHDPRTRVLTLRLLEPLRALGFTHLALENLKQADLAALKSGTLPVTAKVFARDPVLVALVQQASRLGFVLVAYDAAPSFNAQQREAAAADALAALLEHDDQARLLVHAGYAHVHEAPGQLFQQTQPLAMQLRDRTGLDPLTVDQAVLRADPEGREHPWYRPIIASLDDVRLQAADALACRSPAGEWSLDAARYDYSLVLPPAAPAAPARPHWLRLGGSRQVIANPLRCTAQQWPCLVTAVPVSALDASPADVCLQRDGNGCSELFLAAGDWLLQAWSAGGEQSRVRMRVAGSSPSNP